MYHAKEHEKESERRLGLQKQEYESTIKRHLSFIDQVCLPVCVCVRACVHVCVRMSVSMYSPTIACTYMYLVQLIDDKKVLSEKCEKLVKEVKELDKKCSQKVKTLEEK